MWGIATKPHAIHFSLFNKKKKKKERKKEERLSNQHESATSSYMAHYSVMKIVGEVKLS